MGESSVFRVSPGGFGKGSSYYGQGGINVQKAWELYNSV